MGVTDILVEPAVAEAEPPVTVPMEKTVNVSFSGSVSPSRTSTITEPSSSTFPESSSATGGSFTALTVTVTSPVSDPPFPSVTVYVKVTEAVEPGVGVTEILVEPAVATAEPPVTVPIESTSNVSLSASVSPSITSTITVPSSSTLPVSSSATGSLLEAAAPKGVMGSEKPSSRSEATRSAPCSLSVVAELEDPKKNFIAELADNPASAFRVA